MSEIVPKNVSILLVEDEILVAVLQKKQLENFGYSVHHAKTGEEAVQLIAQADVPVDLILMDIDLGSGIDGTEAAKQILTYREIPVLFVSNHTEREVVDKTESIAGYGYVVKNSGIVVLDASIKMALKLFESKQEEKKAQEARMEFLEILEKALDEIYIFNSRDLRFEYVNTGAQKNLGYSLEELKSMTPVDIKPEYTEATFRERLQPLLQGTVEELHFETIHRRKDGSPYPVEVHLHYTKKPEGGTFTAFIMDLTDRKKAEEELRESETLFREVFEKHRAVKLLIDPADGKIIDANLAAVDFYGWTKEQLKNMYIHDINILNPEEIAQEMKLAVEQKRNYFQFKHRRADGSIRDVEVYSSPIEIRGKPLLHSIIHDDTDRVRAEQAVLKELAEKELLLREVHHRVKNNLSNLMALLQFQANSTEQKDVRSGLLEALSRVESMQNLYEKLLLSGNYRELSLRDYLEDLSRSIVETYTTCCPVQLKAEIADLNLDTKRAIALGIIINELMTNVLKYAFPGCKNGNISISLLKEGTHIRLIIQDDGVGFSEESLKKKSTGFGLTLVQMLTEELHGTFTMQKNHGTTSIVQFPL
jgi:PAS domain S-box-containing protein